MGDGKKRVAIVGFGFMGHMHYGAWRKARGAKVVAVCDSNLAQITAKVGGNLAGANDADLAKDVKVYADFDEMLENEPLDVVDVTLPTPLHPPMTLKALAKGVNVLCEKPMAIDARTAGKMVAAAKKSKARLMVAQCVRFWPEYVALKDMVDSGRFGRVIAADFSRFAPPPGWQNGGKSWFLDEKKSGGVALDMHLHDADEIHHLFGMPKTVVSAAHRHAGGWTDFISTTYGYDDKVVTSSSSWAMSPTFVWEGSFRVVFEKAVAVLNTHNDNPFVVYPEKGKPFTPKTPKQSGYEAEIKAFLAYLDGDDSAAVTPESACDSVRIVDAEKKSAKLGKAVKP